MENNNTPLKRIDKKTVGLITLGVIFIGLIFYSALPVYELNIAIKVLFVICACKVYRNQNHRTIAILASILLPVEFLAVIVSIATGAFLFSKGNVGKLIFALSTAVSAIALISIMDTIDAIYAISTVIPALVLGLCISKKVDRMSCICLVSASLATIIIIPIFVWASRQGILTSVESFSTGIKNVFSEIINSFTTAFLQIANENQMEIDKEALGELGALSNELIGAFLTISPALIVVFTNVSGFLANILSNDLRLNSGETLEREEMDFSISTTSAWIFIISIFLSFFSLGTGRFADILSATMLNLNIILIPAFLFVGIKTFKLFPRRKTSTARTIILTLLLVYFGAIVVYPLATIGAFNTIKRNKFTKK